MTVAELPRPRLHPALTPVDSGIPDDALTVAELGSRIVATSGRLTATMRRWLVLVGNFDARDGGEAFGLASTARWLVHSCGLSARTATDHVQVARSLRAQPRLVEAMGSGRVSFSHVRAITRVVAPRDNSTVQALVVLAELATTSLLDANTPARLLRGHEKTTVVAHVRVQTLPQPEAEIGSREPVSDNRAAGAARVEGCDAIPDHVLT